jgi:hypothetical protein
LEKYICGFFEEYENMLTSHEDLAWRAPSMQLMVNIIPNIIQPLKGKDIPVTGRGGP